MSNLNYCDEQTKTYLQGVLRGVSVHNFAKDIITQGLTKDCVDAVHDCEIALKCLKKVMHNFI